MIKIYFLFLNIIVSCIPTDFSQCNECKLLSAKYPKRRDNSFVCATAAKILSSCVSGRFDDTLYMSFNSSYTTGWTYISVFDGSNLDYYKYAFGAIEQSDSSRRFIRYKELREMMKWDVENYANLVKEHDNGFNGTSAYFLKYIKRHYDWEFLDAIIYNDYLR